MQSLIARPGEMAIALLIGLCVLFNSAAGQDLTVSITVTPPSPPYQAASWISFTCFSSGIIPTYNWTLYCAHNEPPGQPRFVDSLPNSNFVRLRSTPSLCIDMVVCTSRDLITGNTGEATWTLGAITGIGFWGTGPHENNAAVEANSLGQFGTIFCHSSLTAPNTGQWFGPDGAEITHNVLDKFSIEFFDGEGYPSYSSIEILSGHQFSSSDQGVYTCLAPDNNGVVQMATIWIFPHNFQTGTLQFSVVGRTSLSPYTLSCDTTGLPATIVRWTKQSSTLVNGQVYDIQQNHSNNFTPDFTNRLVIRQALHELEGVYSCSIVSGIYKPPTTNPDVSNVKHFIGVYSVGTEASIMCNLDDSTIIRIQWETAQGTVASNITMLSFTASDAIHNVPFYCRAYNASGNVVTELLFLTVINIPESTLSAVTSTSDPVATLGTSYSVACLAAITANPHALQSLPTPSFLYSNRSMVSSRPGVTLTGPEMVTSFVISVSLVFNPLTTSHAGEYICQVSLVSPALDATLVKEESLHINLQLPQPTTAQISASHSSPYYAGSVISLTCDTTDSSLVDTDINVHFTWTRDGVELSGDNHVTIVSTGYRSALTITQLHHERDSGSYQCAIHFSPTISTSYLTPSATTLSSLLNLEVSVQSLLVSMNPTEVTILDLPPHNAISISCLATDQDDTTVGTKSFNWTKQACGSPVTTELQHNGGPVSITNTNVDQPTSMSVLVTSEVQAATYVYTCMSVLTSSDGSTQLATGATTASVIVKGPANPVFPTSVSATVLSFSTARIDWTIPSIAYTQEMYTVICGTDSSVLSSTSAVVTGTSELNTVNQVYSVILTELEEGMTYYYRIQSRNTIGRVTDSALASFSIEDSPIITALFVRDPSLSPTAGQSFSLVCEAVEHESTAGLPVISWIDAQGNSVVSNENGVYVNTSQIDGTQVVSILEFQPLRVTFSQEYTCRIDVMSIGLVKTHTYNLQVIAQTIPATIQSSNTVFLAAHSLHLSCVVDLTVMREGFTLPVGEVTFSWSSYCIGSCFVNAQSTQNISTTALGAIDSGLHWCTVRDSVGNIGNASIEISVRGVGIYSPLVGTIANNSFTVISNGGLETLSCKSGSTQPDVGRWIAPNGQDVTQPGDHPFNVIRGGVSNPGSLEISLTPEGRFSSSELLGVYSCVIPDEGNAEMIIHVGIYASTPSGVIVSSLAASSSSLFNVFVVNCTSTSSTATSVSWYKNEEPITAGFIYQTLQILRDGVTSTYDNLLLVQIPSVDELPGLYRCEVSNDVTGLVSMRSVRLQGLRVTAQDVYELGSTAGISCSSDFGVSSIEWLYNGEVVHRVEGTDALLAINNITDTDHGKEYTCRVFARFGNQEQIFRLQVEVSADDLTISIEPSSNQPLHNQFFSLTCIVVKATGLTGTPTVEWYDGMGNRLGDTLPNGTSIQSDIGEGPTYTSTVSFQYLDELHSGEYVCRTEIVTLALPYTIADTAEWDLIVQDPTTGQPPSTQAAMPCTKTFQLLLSDVNDCQNYRFSDQESKINSIIDSIVLNVNSIGFDACTVCRPLTSEDITQPTFDCDPSKPTSVLFRAMILGNGTCDEVILVITNWVESGRALVTVTFNSLRANKDCSVEVDSADAQFPVCDALHPGQQESTDIGLPVGAAVGAIVSILIVVVIIVVGFIFCKRRRSKRFHVSGNGPDNFDNPGFISNRTNESYGMYSPENPYYYATGPGQTNSMIPLAGRGFRHTAAAPPKLPPRDELMDDPTDELSRTDSMNSYIKMNSAKFQGASVDFYDDVSCMAAKDEQLYEEIPAKCGDGVYDEPNHIMK